MERPARLDDGLVNASERVLVYGATGHTGRFVVDELLRRGLTPVLAGRSAERLAARRAAARRPRPPRGRPRRPRPAAAGGRRRRRGDQLRRAVPRHRASRSHAPPSRRARTTSTSPPSSRSCRSCTASSTPRPVTRASPSCRPWPSTAGWPTCSSPTRSTGDARADEVEVAIGLDRWWPTAGTRATGVRNTATRLVIRDGVLTPLASPAPTGTWSYPAPLGEQPSCSCRSPRSSRSTAISTSASSGPTSTPPRSTTSTTPRPHHRPRPTSADARPSSSSSTSSYAVASDTRRISATGRDIYAVTAPIVVEGAVRLLDGRHRGPGAAAPGEAFDAGAVLAALERDADGLAVRRDWVSPRLSSVPARRRVSSVGRA